ncbi:hypothetical protein N7493_000953 [Penicillium malachiteum]|uniref:Uncharacterized protein n=1 Tax=Penicillium malachiteum TaxID=1324776 RepID=A0AAD6HXW4_9EURO|nr:hypothetical protein N7493_000953 [Penicillium malachiteum]
MKPAAAEAFEYCWIVMFVISLDVLLAGYLIDLYAEAFGWSWIVFFVTDADGLLHPHSSVFDRCLTGKSIADLLTEAGLDYAWDPIWSSLIPGGFVHAVVSAAVNSRLAWGFLPVVSFAKPEGTLTLVMYLVLE